MPIPLLNELGELPPGIHSASLTEIELEFGSSTPRRVQLMAGLKQAVANFQQAGVQRIYLDGSFTTSKDEPNDIDGCWSAQGNINEKLLDPLFWNFQSDADVPIFRDAVKAKYGLDFYIAEWTEVGSGKSFPDFFQTNRDGEPKGILQVNL